MVIMVLLAVASCSNAETGTINLTLTQEVLDLLNKGISSSVITGV
jgi:hypothetical protein